MSSTSCDIWQFGISSARIMFSLWFLFLWCFPVLGSFFFSSSVCSVTFIFLCCQNPRKFFKSPPHSSHSKRCWKHSFETLIHVNINVPHTICKSIVSCKLKQKKKSSITSQRCCDALVNGNATDVQWTYCLYHKISVEITSASLHGAA